jgi:hypothetical protein
MKPTDGKAYYEVEKRKMLKNQRNELQPKR